MERRTASRQLFAAALGAAALSSRSEAQSCVTPCWPQTARELAATVTPTNTAYRPGDWRRYGADPTGSTDSTAAIVKACKANGLSFDEYGGTYLVSSSIAVPSGVTVRGAGSSTVIKSSNGDSEIFSLSGVTSASVESLRILYTAAGATAAASVYVFNSTACSVCDVEISAGTLWGIVLWDCSSCVVSRCYFHGALSSANNSSDIMVYNNSSSNVISDNQCFGGNSWFGIMIQDPYNSSHPSKNLVANNRVGPHAAYGIALYLPTAGDSYNQLTGNYIEGITGSVLGGDAGAGIYVVGAGAGGTEITANTIRNCCIQTTGRSLAPAAIGVSGLSAANAPVSINNNVVDAMPTYDGILLVNCLSGASIVGNSIRNPSGATGTPIRVENSSSVCVASNVITQPTTVAQRCILFYANGSTAVLSQVSVTGNTCKGGNFNQIDFAVAGTYGFSGVVCSNNNCRGAGSAAYCISLYKVDQVVVGGNVCAATTQAAFWANTTTNCRILGNSFASSGSTGAGSSGTCTGWYDKSNFQTGTFVSSGITVDV